MKGCIMKVILAILFSALILISCVRQPASKPADISNQTTKEMPVENAVASGNVQPLAFDNLVGTWLHLDSDGGVDSTGDSVRITKQTDGYYAILTYQRTNKNCKLYQKDNLFWLVAQSGENYKVTRLRSMHPTGNNGIGISLITGADDISLGFFQREDILKQLEGQ